MYCEKRSRRFERNNALHVLSVQNIYFYYINNIEKFKNLKIIQSNHEQNETFKDCKFLKLNEIICITNYTRFHSAT